MKKSVYSYDLIQEQLCVNYYETMKYEMERVKSKLAKIASIKTINGSK